MDVIRVLRFVLVITMIMLFIASYYTFLYEATGKQHYMMKAIYYLIIVTILVIMLVLGSLIQLKQLVVDYIIGGGKREA